MGDDDGRAFRVDLAVLAVAFAAALRRAGIPSTSDRAMWLVDAVRLVPPNTRSELYWTCRTVFVTAQHQLARFDEVFEMVFGGAEDFADRGDPNAPDLHAAHRRTAADDRPVRHEPSGGPDASVPPATAGSDDSGSGDDREATDAFLLAASSEERLHDASFAALEPDELARMRELVSSLALAVPVRPGRRERSSPHARDRLNMRRTTRAARRSGGDAVRLFYSRPLPRSRPLVLLCDVSASMEPYTQVFLSLMQAAVVGARAEAFVFATRLTRLTRHLKLRDPDRAFEHATRGAEDWASGTRLADGIREFIDKFGRRGVARGAVVVILSDGWAQDDPAEIERQMARLARLAHRIIWVNPRKAARGYEPLAGGMAAALPFCDAFLSGHSYTALQSLVGVIADDSTPLSERRKI